MANWGRRKVFHGWDRYGGESVVKNTGRGEVFHRWMDENNRGENTCFSTGLCWNGGIINIKWKKSQKRT